MLLAMTGVEDHFRQNENCCQADDQVESRIGGVIYRLFAVIGLLSIASSGSNNRGSPDGRGEDIGQVLAGAALNTIGRDMRRVPRELKA
jgi:hypothetical protein